MNYKTIAFTERVHKVFGTHGSDQLKEIKLPEQPEQPENNDVRDFLVMLNTAYTETKKRNSIRFR